MTTADEFEAEFGSPVFQTTFQALAEGLDGNGVLDAGDLKVTAGTNSNSLDVAATTRGLWYGSTLYTYAGGTNVVTLSANSSGSDRWDLVYFDTADSTPKAREGTPATKPDLPLLQAGEFPLAAVYVADTQADVSDSEIRNYRVHGQAAEEAWFEDPAGLYANADVESALENELQYAAQLTGYPLPLADLNSPYALPSITDMDAAGNDLVDGATTVWDTSAGEVPQGVLGGPASSLSAYPLTLTDLASPFALPSITDMDAAGNDLVDGATTVWDTSEGFVPRGSLDQNRSIASVSTNTTTSDEEILFVDTSGGAVTITLASADAVSGNHVIIVDSGGATETNPLTIDTEGAETIDGGSSVTVETNYGAQVLSSNGSNWYTAGGGSGAGLDREADFDHSGSKTSLTSGNQAIVGFAELDASETLNIYKAQLLRPTGQPSSTSVDLKLVSFDNAGGFTTQATLIAGDGSTVYDDQTGDPLGSYSPSATETVGVLVDNQSGSGEGVYAEAKGEVA